MIGEHRVGCLCLLCNSPGEKHSVGTEYADNYHKYSMGDRVMGKPHVTQLTVGGEFNGATERYV